MLQININVVSFYIFLYDVDMDAKDKLHQGFITLLTSMQTSIEDLSVGMLTSIAKVHRVTFYHHFENIEDFITWFLHKDLIIKNEEGPVLIEDAFDRIFSFIEQHHAVLLILIHSSYRPMIERFIEEEAFSYQVSNFKRIDQTGLLTDAEIKFYSMFYAAGILKLIVEFIKKPTIETQDKEDYTKLGVHLIKNYIEELMMRKQRL
jgi:hypothetical protein